MIGYDRLGTNGRLGNQMFQYAALRGIAANNNLEFCIPPEDTPNYANYGLFDCFKLPNVKHVGLIGKVAPGFAVTAAGILEAHQNHYRLHHCPQYYAGVCRVGHFSRAQCTH